MLKELIIKEVINYLVKTVEDNKDNLGAIIHTKLADTDIPWLPDNIEKPVDDALEAAIDSAIDEAIALLWTLKS